MSDFRLIDLALPYQRRFIEAKKKRKLWLSSRQAGKSWALAVIAAFKACSRPCGLSLCVSTGSRAASELIKKVHQVAEAVRIASDGNITYEASADACRFSTGSRVVSLPSGNPSALRGYTAQCVLLDECAFIDNAYDVMQAIAPTLTRDPDAELVVASTPAGRAGLFWDLWSQAGDDWYVQTTTIEDAVREGLAVDVAKLRELCPDPDVFAQEYECRFASEYGSFIDASLLQFADAPRAGVKAKYMGYDVGGSGDRTAIATVLQLEDGTYFVEDVAMMHKADYQRQLDVLKQLFGKFRWNAGYVDSVGIGNPIAEFANKQVSANIHGFAWAASNKTNVHENARALIFDRKLVFASHLQSIVTSDFQNISRVVNEAGQVKYVAGRDANGHSDCASAIFLALWAAHDKPAQMQSPISYMPFSPLGPWRSRLA